MFTQKYSPVDFRVIKILQLYAESLDALEIKASNSFFRLLIDFINSIKNQLDSNVHTEILPVLFKVINLLPESTLISEITSLLEASFIKKIESEKSFEVKKIYEWNLAILNRTLIQKIDINSAETGEIVSLLISENKNEEHAFKLAKFNLILDQKSALNWLNLAKCLINLNQLNFAEIL